MTESYKENSCEYENGMDTGYILPVSIQKRIAVYRSSNKLVTDNTSYVIQFHFDGEWDAYPVKTAQFRYFSKANGWVSQSCVFEGDFCPVPVISCTECVYVGVYAGDILASTEAEIPCLPSPLSFDCPPPLPEENVYNQIMDKLCVLSDEMNECTEALEKTLRYTPMELSEEEKQISRDNISAAEASDSGIGVLIGDNYVTAFGAVGDGTADDTEAFRAALAEKRVVFVPGGTYKLTGGIVIGDNCELELSQDTVLVFENTTGNCITLGMSSSLKGNHATVKVPYAFEGNVIYASTTTSDDVLAVPPFTKWDPQWKAGRYVTDINICKADYRGFHYSVNGECSGTAVYLSAEGNKNTDTSSTFMWGVHYSGLRIAGAFKYGIHAENFHEGWNHEMRMEAFIEACEIGVFLKDCNNAYISAVVQPKCAYSESAVYKPYAKHGIVLTRSRNADLSGSRVWDWNETHSLWAIDNEYQHIAMYGDCRGLILNDYLYYETSYDIRDLIYTDTPSNLEKMTILQEPITRWFKPKEGIPYFSDGVVEKRITTEEELASYFDTDLVKGYTDVLETAITGKDDPSVFKGKGYGRGYVDTSGVLHDNDAYLTCTGYIPVKQGQTIYAEGLNFKTANDECRIVGYNANFEKVWHTNRELLLTGTNHYAKYTETANGFSVRIEGDANDNTTYVRFNFVTNDISDTPLMAVDEEIKYTVEGFLADSIKVKAENVIGGGSGGGSVGGNSLLGQTPITLNTNATIKLVGSGEHTYTVKGKTVADLSTVTYSETGVNFNETNDYIEISATQSDNWHSSHLDITVRGLTVGESYILAIKGLGVTSIDDKLSNNGYYIIKDSSGADLATSPDIADGTSVKSISFTATTANINIIWYPASNYWWSREGHRASRISDIYINKASDGTTRTAVINESGTFTDSYVIGALSKGVTITSSPSCEVYSMVSGGSGGSAVASKPLEGKKVVCFGDSLFGMYTGDTSAPAYVAEITGAEVYNVGFGGCRMSVHPTSGYAEFCMWALAKAIAENDWTAQDAAVSMGASNFPEQLEILKGIDFSEVEYAVIHYGTNDFNGAIIDNKNNLLDYSTLCGALRYSVKTLLSAYPKLNIFVSLPAFRFWVENGVTTYSDERVNTNGNTLPEFVKALAETAREYNLPVIDCYYGLGINKDNASTFLADGVHHNPDGRKRFGEYIGKKLISNGDTSICAEDGNSDGGSVQADLAQNDTNLPDYVKNRTHWVEFAEETLIDNATIDIENFPVYAFALVEGQEYTIIVDGVEYTETAIKFATDEEDLIYVGNLLSLGGDDNGKPYTVVYMVSSNITLVACSTEDPITITLKTIGEQVHALPKKYIADYLPYMISIVDGITAETSEHLKTVLDSGRPIIAVYKIQEDGALTIIHFYFSNYIKIYSLNAEKYTFRNMIDATQLTLTANADGGFDVEM